MNGATEKIADILRRNAVYFKGKQRCLWMFNGSWFYVAVDGKNRVYGLHDVFAYSKRPSFSNLTDEWLDPVPDDNSGDETDAVAYLHGKLHRCPRYSTTLYKCRWCGEEQDFIVHAINAEDER